MFIFHQLTFVLRISRIADRLTRIVPVPVSMARIAPDNEASRILPPGSFINSKLGKHKIQDRKPQPIDKDFKDRMSLTKSQYSVCGRGKCGPGRCRMMGGWIYCSLGLALIYSYLIVSQV